MCQSGSSSVAWAASVCARQCLPTFPKTATFILASLYVQSYGGQGCRGYYQSKSATQKSQAAFLFPSHPLQKVMRSRVPVVRSFRFTNPQSCTTTVLVVSPLVPLEDQCPKGG